MPKASLIKLLEGVRVLECAVPFNGDQTGRLLGDMGADVVKVEAPGVGDYLRDFLGQITPHHSPAHLYVNRNKRRISLNLRSDAGRRCFFDLLRTADIFVDGFAGDACAKLGIGYEQQREVKPTSSTRSAADSERLVRTPTSRRTGRSWVRSEAASRSGRVRAGWSRRWAAWAMARSLVPPTPP